MRHLPCLDQGTLRIQDVRSGDQGFAARDGNCAGQAQVFADDTFAASRTQERSQAQSRQTGLYQDQGSAGTRASPGKDPKSVCSSSGGDVGQVCGRKGQGPEGPALVGPNRDVGSQRSRLEEHSGAHEAQGR